MDLSNIKSIGIPNMPDVREIKVNGTAIWKKSRLPQTLTEVKKLVLYGDTYFDTHILTSNDISFIGDYATTVEGKLIIGARQGAGSNGFVYGSITTRNVYMANGGATTSHYQAMIPNLRDGVSRRLRMFDGNDEVYLDDVQLNSPTKVDATRFYNVFLGTWNTNGVADSRYYNGELGEWIIKKSNVEVWHGIPCLDKDDRALFYDIVGDAPCYDVLDKFIGHID